MPVDERYPHIPTRLARFDELDELTVIEMDAAEALIEAGVPFPDEPHPLAHDQLAACLSEGLLFVAVDESDRPIGFLAAEEIDGRLYIAEIDVLRRYQRRGIGRGLIGTALDAARRRGFSAAMLTTDRFVPFNYPFYASLGFHEPGPKAAPAALKAILDKEIASGMGADRRAGMVLKFRTEE
ncbi:acetyltransferase (GNAT) family protein [Rhizobium sp. BK251]|nr:acetyltransferase (GNAT) family protein [Rhizobium sp. BK251]